MGSIIGIETLLSDLGGVAKVTSWPELLPDRLTIPFMAVLPALMLL